jgi:3'(2'), 5'-bisphosphate nucleotidase
MLNWDDQKIKFSLQAVQLAARLAGEIQAEMVSESITKDDRSPVTVADFSAQAVIGWMLREEFPEAILVGEESSDILRSPEEYKTLEAVTKFVNRVIPGLSPEQVCESIDRGNAPPGINYWTLDPIDGTKGFLRKAQYACALAYVEDGVVQMGVLGCPNLLPDMTEKSAGAGSLLVGVRGQGSWITPMSNQLVPEGFSQLMVSKCSSVKEARLLRSYESAHTNTGQIDAVQESLGTLSDPVRIDSQVKYALLAAGEGEIYLRLLSPEKPNYREKIWDQAAGSIIVEEAGGRVTDLDGNKLDFSLGRSLINNRGICASNGYLHDQILEVLTYLNT